MDQYILSLSYGKDSLACLGAIEELGWPLDRIVHAEVWATDDIPADLPPMVEFKSKADEWIKEHFGIEVEHVWATRRERERDEPTSPSSTSGMKKGNTSESLGDSPCSVDRGVMTGSKPQFLTGLEKLTYEKIFYRERQLRRGGYQIYGFPIVRGQWCNGFLKRDVLKRLPASRQDGVNTARESSKKTSCENHWVPNLSQERELVHSPQNKSFLIAP